LGPIDQPQKTATELALRQRNLAEQIGPAFTRLQQEFLARLINRIVYILQKKGLMDKLVIDGKEIQISYKSPLVAAQGMQDVQNFMQFYSILQQTQGPEAAIVNLNPVKFPAWLAQKMAVDVTALNTQEEMQKFFEEQSEKMQENEAMMMMSGGGGGEQSLLTGA
ncbi:MAG TPA: portal protein, partial [Nitrosopumilaceae archaeon]|nr:portal protein [Nitrosopumilaceae archaeon]